MQKRIVVCLALFCVFEAVTLGEDKLRVKDDFTPFAPGEYCSEAVSLDGSLGAGADASTGELFYYDLKQKRVFYTGIMDVYNPSIKGLQVAFFTRNCSTVPCSWPWTITIKIYDIANKTVRSTGVSAVDRWQDGPNRYFDGDRIIYKDAVDNRIKIYSLIDESIVDTGWEGRPDPSIDGDFATWENSYSTESGWKSDVVLYQLSSQHGTVISSGVSPVISGQVVLFKTQNWWGSLSYYLINTSQHISTGEDAYVWTTDGQIIVYEVGGQDIRVIDIATGSVESTGVYGCSGGDSCWLDVSGKYISYERWEGGTRITDSTGAIIQVYAPAELNNDTIEHCAAGWFKY